MCFGSTQSVLPGVWFHYKNFVFLRFSCVPLRDFDYVYNYLMFTNVSFIDRYAQSFEFGCQTCFFLTFWCFFSLNCFEQNPLNSSIAFSFLFFNLVALKILVHMVVADTRSICYLKSRKSSFEKVHRYMLQLSRLHPLWIFITQISILQ